MQRCNELVNDQPSKQPTVNSSVKSLILTERERVDVYIGICRVQNAARVPCQERRLESRNVSAVRETLD